MSTSKDIARWLRLALSDGPLPSRLIHEALAPNGWPTTDDDQLDRARKLASVTTRRRGTFTAGWWEMRILGDDSADRQLLDGPWTAHACVTCGWTAQLPLGTWRRCVHTATCPGTYQPQPSPPHQLSPQTPDHSFRNIADLGFRGRGSPLRGREQRIVRGAGRSLARPSPRR